MPPALLRVGIIGCYAFKGSIYMKVLRFRACNHGCKAKKASGQAGNGRCKFPDLDHLENEAANMMISHPDSPIRRFAEKVFYLIEHIEEVEESAA
jgi:hypothetical protein